MRIFNQLTKRMLKENKTRTLVTLIGIALSMTLLTAVIEGAVSGMNYLREAESENVGSFEAVQTDLTEKQAKKISNLSKIKQSRIIKEVGWAPVNQKNTNKPYLLIQSVPSDITDLVSIHITEGRMPKNDNEILLPNHLMDFGFKKLPLYSSLDLNLGQRRLAGRIPNTNEFYEASDENEDSAEEWIPGEKRTYKVVGYYERINRTIEDYKCPGFMALTTGSAGDGRYSVVFTVKNPLRIKQLPNSDPDLFKNIRLHSELLRTYGLFLDSGWQEIFIGFVSILLFLIVFGSISLIRNSFGISVGERTRKYGMLRSIGATRKQLTASVLYEAFLLSLAAIPIGLLVGCGGIGLTLFLLRDNFRVFVSDIPVYIHLKISLPGLMLAAILCLLTVLLSALHPAIRAGKMSPMEALKQTRDIKIRKKDLGRRPIREGHLAYAMARRNYKRNRGRSFSTVFALFASIVLFVSASAYSSYLMKLTKMQKISEMDVSMNVSKKSSTALTDALSLSQECLGLSGIKEGAGEVIITAFDQINFEKEKLEPKYRSVSDIQGSSYVPEISFLDDYSFRKLLKENNLSEKDYMDKNHPLGLIFNQNSIFVNGGEPKKIKMVDSDAFPISAVGRLMTSPDALTENMDIAINLTIGAELKTRPWFAERDAIIYYPQSLMENVLGQDLMNRNNGMSIASVEAGFRGGDHAKIAEDGKKMMDEKHLNGFVLDNVKEEENTRMLIMVVNVFAYGFIILISLIAVTNVFNIISTSMLLRKGEFAMLRSIGLSRKELIRMLEIECASYGSRALLTGIPVSCLISYLLYLKVMANSDLSSIHFYIPWQAILTAIASTAAVVYISMRYAERKISKENLIDALKDSD